MITSTDFEDLQHPGAIPAAEFLRPVDQRRGDQRARQQSVAYRRIEIIGAFSQSIQMQRGAFAGGDDIGRGAGARGFRNFDGAQGAERPGDASDRLLGFGRDVVLKISAGDGDPQPADIPREQRRDRLGGPGGARRVVGVRPLHRIIGQREIADAARERTEMIEARDERKRPRAGQPAIGRLQSEDSAER